VELRSLVTIAAVGMTAALLTSCTSSVDMPNENPSPTEATSASPTPTPEESTTPDSVAQPFETWQRALDATALAGSADIDTQLITNVEGFERITQGNGWIDVTTGTGDITWTDDRSQTREVRSPTGHFLELDGTWFAVPGDLPTTVAFFPLEGLTGATDASLDGSEDVLGFPTTKLTATLPADAASLGFSQEELSAFDPSTGSLQATIWIDGDDRIVRVLREYSTTSLDGDFVEAVSLSVLTGFGAERPLDIPETADAIPAPA